MRSLTTFAIISSICLVFSSAFYRTNVAAEEDKRRSIADLSRRYESVARFEQPAATASISGRVFLHNGAGIPNALVVATDSHGVVRTTFTSSFGLYTLANLPAPETYTVRPASKKLKFFSKTIVLSGDVTGVDFLDINDPGPFVNAGPDQVIVLPSTIQLQGNAISGVGGPMTFSWSVVSGPGVIQFSNSTSLAPTATASLEGIYILRFTVVDGPFTEFDDVQVTVKAENTPPPADPVSVAPALNPSTPTNIAKSTKFLYTGPDPIQTGVAPETIKPERASLIRGRVLNKLQQAIPNVVISIIDHPELGQTRSREDGMFDMVVNAGGELTFKYEKSGFIPVQRETNVEWQSNTTIDDVSMIAYDPSVSVIDLSSNQPIQVASGGLSSDTSGQRRPRLFFKQGTTATITLPDNSTQTLTTLHVRSTEFTVGDTGRAAMPGELPPTSEYTYASEYSADEAIALNAVSTRFSQPVIQYLENYIGFPTGAFVPTGSYNRKTGNWEAEQSGKVVKILSVSNGAANLDVDGEGLPATDLQYAELGINLAEREKLTEFYQPNQSLWRVPLAHFSPWDCNYPSVKKPDPDAPPPFPEPEPDKECECEPYSPVEIQSQTVNESLPITLTGYEIVYDSGSQKGFQQNEAVIPLVGPSPDPDLQRAGAQIYIAGRHITTDQFPSSANLKTTFKWDGLDSYGRPAQGAQKVSISVTHFYPLEYSLTDEFGQTGSGSGQSVVRQGTGITFRNYEITLGGFDRGRAAIGGWDFANHHTYDPITRTLYQGDGKQRSTTSIEKNVITTAGQFDEGFAGDGGPATAAKFSSPSDIAFAPDGSYYIADRENNRIRRVGKDGIVSTFAGNGSECDPMAACGDGGPAANASLSAPQGIAVSPDGSVYISDTNSNRIRKVAANGTITTFAGTGAECQPSEPCGDNGVAMASKLNKPNHIHIAEDGSLFIADSGSNRVRKVGTNGNIRTVAGSGQEGCESNNVPALAACIESPSGVALTPNGSLYITANAPDHSQVVRLDTDGKIHKIADGICNGAFARPEGLRSICNPGSVIIGPDGNPYVASQGENRIYKYDTDEVWKEVVGSGSSIPDEEGLPVLKANLREPAGSAFAPNGDLYVTDTGDNRIRRAASPLPGFSNGNLLIASEDGTEVFEFDADGRHLRTLNALTGTNKTVFGYNSDGDLSSITDGDNNVTTIVRDRNGNPTGIRSPYGQVTTLGFDSNGYLESVTNPAGETTRYTYTSSGLMLTKRDPRNTLNTFTYDQNGRIEKNDNAAGGFHTLTRTGDASDFTVTHKTPVGRESSFRVQNTADGDEIQDITFEDGSKYHVTTSRDGSIDATGPEGTTVQSTTGPDPRWGMQAPIRASGSFRSPAGRGFNITQTRTVSLQDPANPFSIIDMHDMSTLNGNNYLADYTGSNRTFDISTPMLRRSKYSIDSQERITQFQFTNLNAVNYTYDSRGRLSAAATGSGSNARGFTNSFNTAGYISSQTDALNRTRAFQYDLAGRPTQTTFADNRVIGFGYDANSNLTSFTPPGRPAHSFTYNPRNLLLSYTAPNVGGNSTTSFQYNADSDLTRITRPDGEQINFAYNSFGQLQTRSITAGNYGYTYNSQTGQLTAITAPDGISNSFEYDGSIVTRASVTGPAAGSVEYTFDNNLNVATIAVNGTTAIDYRYDSDNLLTGAGGMQIDRSPVNGLQTGSALGNVNDSITYNGFGEPESYTAKFNAATIYSANYTYNKIGRIVRKTETIGGVSTTFDYGFDATDRLATVTLNNGPQPTITYGYDSNDNRTSVNLGGNIATAAYDNQDRMTSYGNTVYTYTQSGDLKTKTQAGATTTYNYDSLGNLRGVTLPGGTQIEYLIDGLDRRVGKRVNGALEQSFLYQGKLQVAAESDAAGNVVSRFIYASSSNKPDFMLKNGQIFRVICDNVGSVRLIVDITSGNIVQRIDYDEFGVVLTDTNPGFQPFGFAGGIYDRQTGLTRFGARDYDASSGRWTAKDPKLFGGGDTNVYNYAASDPVNNFDLEGTDIYGPGFPPPDGMAIAPNGQLIPIPPQFDRTALFQKLNDISRQIAEELAKKCPSKKRLEELNAQQAKVLGEIAAMKQAFQDYMNKYFPAPPPSSKPGGGSQGGGSQGGGSQGGGSQGGGGGATSDPWTNYSWNINRIFRPD